MIFTATLLGSEKQYHINTTPEDIGKYVILCGDPERVPLIAKHFENSKQISFNREYNVYTGFLDGTKVSCVSTGIGGPSSAIAVEELVRCGAHHVCLVYGDCREDLKLYADYTGIKIVEI